MKNLLQNKAGATDVVPNQVTEIAVNTDANAYARLGWLIVLVGIGGFLLWSIFAPLDKGVPVQGSVSVATNRKAVQHLTGGIVDDILVKDGDVVKAGQPLAKMSDVQARANADVTRVQYYTARAAEVRLVAERDGKGSITFPEDLLKAKSDPQVGSIIAVQTQLFASRQAAINNDLSATDESILGLKAQLKGLEETGVTLKQQQELLKEQLDNMRELGKEGYVARNRVLDLERTYAQINGGISENIGNIGRVQRQISELTLRRIQRQQEYQKEVRTMLTDIQKEAEAQASRLKSYEYDLANAVVKAPVDGTVVGVTVFTRGGVISPGFKLMDIVPSDDPLIVEGVIPVNLIDKVHAGLKVELIFSAFNHNSTPHIPGILTQVAADRTVDEKTGMSFYRMKAQVEPEGMKLLSKLEVRPGMPVDIFIKTGERTMMNYLLKPVMDRAKTALTEE